MRSIDPATPQAYPDIFMPVKCLACTRCWLNRRVGRCPAGGPFDANLRVAPRAFIPLTAKEL